MFEGINVEFLSVSGDQRDMSEVIGLMKKLKKKIKEEEEDEKIVSCLLVTKSVEIQTWLISYEQQKREAIGELVFHNFERKIQAKR